MKPWHAPLTRTERIATVAALLLAGALCWPVRDYLTDDTFIHLQYARHVAAGKGLVFNLGERVYGCTSPLWVLLIADLSVLGIDGLLAARLLGWAATLAGVVFFMQLARRVLRTPAVRAAAVLAWASHAWFVRWSLSGMETSVATALVLAGFVAFTEGERWGARPIRTGALWSLAALARPEAAVLLFLWALFLLLDAQERESLARLFFGLLPVALIYGGWLLFARVYFGSYLPQTLSAKSAGSASLEFLLDNLRRQGLIVAATDGILVALLALALTLGWRTVRAARRSWIEEALPLAWIVCLPPLYATRGVQVLSRYLVPALPLLALWAWRALEAWWRPADLPEPPAESRRLRAVFALVAMAVIAQNFTVYRTKVLPQVWSFTAAMQTSLVDLGRWFGRHTPPGTLIATPDIGALGYYSQRPILDLAGLVTPAMVPFLEREPPESAVRQFRFAAFARPDFLVDRAPEPYALLRDSPYAAALVALRDVGVPNLGLARPEPAHYSVYRVDWDAYDRIAGAPAPRARPPAREP